MEPPHSQRAPHVGARFFSVLGVCLSCDESPQQRPKGSDDPPPGLCGGLLAGCCVLQGAMVALAPTLWLGEKVASPPQRAADFGFQIFWRAAARIIGFFGPRAQQGLGRGLAGGTHEFGTSAIFSRELTLFPIYIRGC